MVSQNVIGRRKLDPLLVKACEIIPHYEKAARCYAAVLGPDCYPVDDSKSPKICALCITYCRNPEKTGLAAYPCMEKHFSAVEKSQRFGGLYIYMCDMGFVFWTSPFFSGKRFAGALTAGGFIGVTRAQAAENLRKNIGREIPEEEITRHLEQFPEKTCEEVKALAQMMLICAQQFNQDEEEISEKPAEFSCGKEDNGMEQKLLASLRRGDIDEARKILDGLWESMNTGDNFESLQIKAIEMVVLLSRAAAGMGDSDHENILETNNRFLKKIEEAKTADELSNILKTIIDRMSSRMFSFQGVRHSSALRKAERYIWENYARKISLRSIARAAGLSAPYFSTIFKNEMGENFCNYLNRLRVGKAAAMLAETNMPINKISSACGFEDQSWFSKIFKCYTGLSPGKYREQGGTCAPPDFFIKKIS